MILIISGLIAKIVGAIYRIPLTNILGAEGIGLYQLIFPIYALMLTMSSSGVPTSIARLVSEKRALGDDRGLAEIKRAALSVLLIGGIVFMFIMTALSYPIALSQGNPNMYIGYIMIAPAILFVAVGAYYKGYFQGMMMMTPTAISQIVEQIFKLALGLLFAYLLIDRSIIAAVIGALGGLVIAEMVATLNMAIIYLFNRRKSTKIKVKLNKDAVKQLLLTMLPITLSGIIFPLTQFIDSILIINVLKISGMAQSAAVADYGLLTGTVNTLINMPIVITLSLAVAIVPYVSALRADRNADAIRDRAALSIKLSYYIGVPCFFAIYFLATPIIQMFYPALSIIQQETAAKLMQIMALSIISLSSMQIYTSILQALGKSIRPVYNTAIACAVKIILDFVLIYYLGIMGAAIASILCYLLATLLNGMYYRKLLGKNLKLTKSISKILLNGVIIGLLIWPVAMYIHNKYIAVALGVSVGIVAYAALTFIIKVFDREELLSLPIVNRFVKPDVDDDVSNSGG